MVAASKNNQSSPKRGGRGGARPGAGRKPGVPNKITTQLKDMILTALEEAHEEGAVGYLKSQATANPAAFLTLLGKVIPLQVTGGGDAGEHVHRIILEGVMPK